MSYVHLEMLVLLLSLYRVINYVFFLSKNIKQIVLLTFSALVVFFKPSVYSRKSAGDGTIPNNVLHSTQVHYI